jgi:hypothetical protein
MAWGNNTNIITTNLDSSSDDPSLARADILAAIQELQAVITGRTTANGVAPLDASALIPNTYLPDNIVSSSGNNLLIQPSTGIAYINYLINLQTKTVAQLEALTPIPNMVALVSDGDGGDPCLAVYTGVNSSGVPVWYRVPLDNRVSATLERVINLPSQTVSALTALTSTAGDIAYCSNGDSGSPCFAVYNGTAWKRIALGATISAT